MAELENRHVVVVIGGAVAGAEAAMQLAERNVLTIVLEQHSHPYGKIEDGLPRWHQKLQAQEKKKINAKLSHPGIIFVPQTKLGGDLTFEEIRSWGLSAIVLANGAWRDRSLPIPGIDRFLGRGLYYQNAFVYWFNHYLDPGYSGPKIEPADGALVVGGGLASLDVVKILMLETVTRALAARGQEVSLYELEVHGIHKFLAERDMTLPGLGLRGCTLTYRRKAEDMPLAEAKGERPEQMEQARNTRRKLLRNFMDKYLFHYQDELSPIAFIERNGCLRGLEMASTRVLGQQVLIVPGTNQEIMAPLVVSSIGSIPEPIPGIPMSGQAYRLKDTNTGELEGLTGVYVVGNAVTGKGNILASVHHGRAVSQHMLENYLLGTASGYEEVFADAAADARAKAGMVAAQIAVQAPLAAARVADILARVKQLQARSGYYGNYGEWISKVSAL